MFKDRLKEMAKGIEHISSAKFTVNYLRKKDGSVGHLAILIMGM